MKRIVRNTVCNKKFGRLVLMNILERIEIKKNLKKELHEILDDKGESRIRM